MSRRPRSPEWLRAKNRLDGGRFGYTATYRYGDALRTVAARSKAECNMHAREYWGEWDGDPCYSNPASIYRDLVGETRRRHSRRGLYSAMTDRT